MVGGQAEDALGGTQQEQRVVREQLIDHAGGGGADLDGAARRDLGADALALQLSAIARYATASSLLLRRVCAAHRRNRAAVGPYGLDAAKSLARDPRLTRQVLHQAHLDRDGGARLQP